MTKKKISGVELDIKELNEALNKAKDIYIKDKFDEKFQFHFNIADLTHAEKIAETLEYCYIKVGYEGSLVGVFFECKSFILKCGVHLEIAQKKRKYYFKLHSAYK